MLFPPPSLPIDIAVARAFAAPRDDLDDALVRWQAHLDGPRESNTFAGTLDARRIGNVPPTPPAVAAQRAANDALFRGIARDRLLSENRA